MRITTEARAETRRRILDRAASLFAGRGFARTTTRDIAAAAGIASGTLFNYFPSKEALGLALVAELAVAGRDEFRRRPATGPSLAEDLFAVIGSEIRSLEPLRPVLGELVGATGWSAPAATASAGEEPKFPGGHLDVVTQLLGERRLLGSMPEGLLHLYLSLYLGVLAFWSGDESPHQCDTLSLLDQSTQVFARLVEQSVGASKESDDADDR